MMRRFRLHEFTLKRIGQAVLRRAMELPHDISWYFPSRFVVENKQRLQKYHNIHIGQRCFIMGNGPSISQMDLSPLAGEITFGMNRIYLAFDWLPFKPTYYVCVNELVLEQFAEEIHSLEMEKFLNWNRRYLFSPMDDSTNFIKLSLAIRDRFNHSLQHPFYSGGTVTFVCLQLAYLMGFSEVVLIGIDHSFVEKGTPNRVDVRQAEQDQNHFHPNYFPKGAKWQLPDLLRSEIAYSIARQAFEERGGKIIDATVGGKCPIFERSDFSSLFET